MRVAVVVLLALVGCRDRGTPASDLRCEPTLSAMRDRLVAYSVQGIALRTEVMIASCEGDRWAPAVLRCLDVAKDERALDRCLHQLTHEQFVRLSGTLAPLGGPPSTPLDAGVAAGADAHVRDASVDAMVLSPITDAAVVRPRPPSDARKLDCSRRVTDPRDPDCRRSFCLANPHEPVCTVE